MEMTSIACSMCTFRSKLKRKFEVVLNKSFSRSAKQRVSGSLEGEASGPSLYDKEAQEVGRISDILASLVDSGDINVTGPPIEKSIEICTPRAGQPLALDEGLDALKHDDLVFNMGSGFSPALRSGSGSKWKSRARNKSSAEVSTAKEGMEGKLELQIWD